jgi:DNA-directed RNA polymerase specialized sigma24 family protein
MCWVGAVESNRTKRDPIESLPDLLRFLNHDPEKAGAVYCEIYDRLVIFFAGRGNADPTDCADETLARVGQRLADIQPGKLLAFSLGVARRVSSEKRTLQRRERPIQGWAGDSLSIVQPDVACFNEEQERKAEVLDGCLGPCMKTLDPRDQLILKEYYKCETGEKIANRRELAKSLNMSMNALRVRACKARAVLRACLVECVTRQRAEK